MRVQTGRNIGLAWATAAIGFAACVAVVRSIGNSPATQAPGLIIGYVGLAGVGAALVLTFRWIDRDPPRNALARAGIQFVLGLTFVVWLFALVFPFL